MQFTPLFPAIPMPLPQGAAHRAGYEFSDGAPVGLRLPGLDLALPSAVRAAVPQRQAEFLAGRACAALALRDLGAGTHMLAIGSDRGPVWPGGFTGSISHAGGEAVAVAARTTDYRYLGIDVEVLMPDAQALQVADSILSTGDEELRPTGMDEALFLTLVFSAKEALYKGLAADLGRVIDFHQARVVGLTDLTLQLALSAPLQAELDLFQALSLRYSINAAVNKTPRVLCLLAIRA